MNNLAINEKMFDTIIGIQSLDNSCINKGKEIFEQYKKKNIIIDSLFSDIRWQFSDEYSNVGIRFNFNEVSYNQHYKKFFTFLILHFVIMQRPLSCLPWVKLF